MLTEVRCTKCTTMILRKSRDGYWRVSSRVLRAADDGREVVAVCKGCGTEQKIPMILSMPPMTQIQQEALKKGFTIKPVAETNLSITYKPKKVKKSYSST